MSSQTPECRVPAARNPVIEEGMELLEQVEQLAATTATVIVSLEQADEEDAYPAALPWHRR